MEGVDFEVIRLATDALVAEVQPAYGGRLLALHENGAGGRIDWLEPARPASVGSTEHVKAGCFPMVPYCNRIRSGQLHFDGQRYDVGGVHPWVDACHGQGFLNHWTVESRSSSELAISYEHVGADWPTAYRARQRFALKDRTLSIDLWLENVGERPMPGGLGLHPYFPFRRNAEFEIWADYHWPLLPDFLVDHEELSPFGRGIVHAGSGLLPGSAYCLSRWQGQAAIRWRREKRTLTIRASPELPVCTLFAPEDSDTLCVEPSSHLIGGLTMLDRRAETHVRVLAPGELLHAAVEFIAEHR